MKATAIKTKKLKKLPIFKTEDEEREFWDTHSSTDYYDWSKARRGIMFPNLKPTTQPINIRLSLTLLNRLKAKANLLDLPYQSYIKTILNKEVGLN